MSTATLDFTYRYAFASEVGPTPRGLGLQLATCGAKQEQPHFFDGRLLAPRQTGEMLLVLSDVVRTHFFLPRPPMTDPVVTCSESMLRFEGFSGCCGVYARVDIPAEAFHSDHLGHGTTNVDFNSSMRAALAKLRDHDNARLSVGKDSLEFARGDQRVIEKKVKLPIRWIKGFSEVQAYQPLLKPKLEVDGTEARKFVRSLPRSGVPKRPSFVTKTSGALRLSQREAKGSVSFYGTHRVRVLEPLMNTAKSLRVWSDDDSGTTAWEVTLRAGRFFLLLSPELYRGFSGEGQVLDKLAGNQWQNALPEVQKRLNWQSCVDLDDMARETQLPVEEVEAAMAVLGSRGLAGYDAGRVAYFHRHLPFELDKIENLQPRLAAARKLLETNGVKLVPQKGLGCGTDVEVAGTGTYHLVRLREEGDKCSCPWFSKYQGQRGVCKHILAARMFVDDRDHPAKGQRHIDDSR